MIALEQARAYLEQLGLAQAAAVLDSRLEAASKREAPYAELLADLLGAEAAARRARYLTTRTRLAHLPFQRTLAQFDFAFQPSVDERQVRELATMAFVGSEAAIRVIHVDGPLPLVAAHMSRQPEVKEFERQLEEHLTEGRDMLSPEGARAFFQKAGMENVLNRRAPGQEAAA